MRRWIGVSSAFLLGVLLSLGFVLSGRAQEAALPLLLHEDFSKGATRWEPTDPKAWKLIDLPGGGRAFSQFKNSVYKTRVRSPFNIALVRGLVVGDFVLEAKARSTVKDYGHRDLCLFFGHQGPDRFYYAHLARKTDDRANQIFVVDRKDRVKISTRTTPGTNWSDGWHRLKVVRQVKEGSIKVYFDDMKTPVMTATDRTFTWGRVGIGSFDDKGDWAEVKVYGKRVAPKP